MSKEWSQQQSSIFEWFRAGSGNLVIRARAGTGKTTTIIEGINHAPEHSIILCAFNKKIQEELNRRLTNPRAEAKTLHSIGFTCILRNWKGCRVDADRGSKIVDSILVDGEPREIARLITRLASRCKSTCPFPTLEQVMNEAEEADIILDDSDSELAALYTPEFIARKAMEAMDKACIKDGTVDFDDMVFVALRNKWVFGRWNLVVADESQDMSYSQLLLAQKICKRNGRIVVVGDDRQAIYGFRGADHRSIDRLKSTLKASELGLTITYRCPKKIVALAKELVPDYEAAPTAIDGEISNTSPLNLVKEAQPGDFVLSRKNAPLAKTCLAFLKANKRAFIEGRDIGKSLVTLVKKIKGKSVPDFIARLGKWKERELSRASKLDTETKRDAKAELISDQAETLLNLVEGLSSVGELVARIEALFADMIEGNRGATSIVCSSVHRAKGLERDTVFLLEETFNTRNIEERNIKYVAITRAKNRLVWVTDVTTSERTLSTSVDVVIPGYDAKMIEVGMKHHGIDITIEN